MRAILKAPADLLFFGGIGTYVRAASETDEAVGDRANDAIRVTGADLRCKVVGEGANLGMTQRGRVEAALRGVRLNTDAIDNSAGVNTSDVEVNIKIALATADARRARSRCEARNALLAEMTDEVARAGAAQQLPADAGALARRAARARGPRLPAAPDADAGGRAASSTARSSSCPTTWRSPSAAAARRRSRGPSSRCCSPTPSSRSTTSCWTPTVPDDPYLGARARPLFSQGDRRASSPTRWSSTGCGARSSPPSSPTR